jgi:hypothetical protein
MPKLSTGQTMTFIVFLTCMIFVKAIFNKDYLTIALSLGSLYQWVFTDWRK